MGGTTNSQTWGYEENTTFDAAALRLLQDPDDTHMYVNVLIKSSEIE